MGTGWYSPRDVTEKLDVAGERSWAVEEERDRHRLRRHRVGPGRGAGDDVRSIIFGRIDAVFANAGFGATRGFLEESPEHWRSMVLTNVLGPALTIRATLPHLLERGDGHYLITSSVAGRRALPGSLYSATKFAATAIGEALRQELRQVDDNDRIKVTLIEPGITDTEFFDDKPADWALRDEDIAHEVLHALTAPPGVELNEILIRPTAQRG